MTTKKMNEYEFQLVFKLNHDEDPEQYLGALFDAGCDDSTPGIGRKGHIALHFHREAKDAVIAIISAIRDVKKAIPHARLESAGPYLLNLTELAFEFGFSKQALQKHSSGKTATKEPFPSPFIGGKTSYWRVSEVAQWLKDQKIKDIDKHIIKTLNIIRIVNLELERSRTPSDPDIESKLKEVA